MTKDTTTFIAHDAAFMLRKKFVVKIGSFQMIMASRPIIGAIKAAKGYKNTKKYMWILMKGFNSGKYAVKTTPIKSRIKSKMNNTNQKIGYLQGRLALSNKSQNAATTNYWTQKQIPNQKCSLCKFPTYAQFSSADNSGDESLSCDSFS